MVNIECIDTFWDTSVFFFLCHLSVPKHNNQKQTIMIKQKQGVFLRHLSELNFIGVSGKGRLLGVFFEELCTLSEGKKIRD